MSLTFPLVLIFGEVSKLKVMVFHRSIRLSTVQVRRCRCVERKRKLTSLAGSSTRGTGFTPAQRAQYSVLSPLDFPPLSPNSKLTLPRSSNPTDFADSPSPSVPRPPPSAILDTSGSLPFVESGSEEWLAPSEGFTAAKEALLRPKSSEGGEVEESGTLYWADEPCPPLAQIEQEREQGESSICEEYLKRHR